MAHTLTRLRVPLYRVNSKSRGRTSESAKSAKGPARYLTSVRSSANARTALIRRIGTPLFASGFNEYPFLTSEQSWSVLAQHHPSGSGGRLLVSGATGSLYFAFQFLAGSLSLALNLAS